MVWDHIDPSLKRFEMGQLHKCTWRQIDIEIAKCRVMCAVCHAVHSWHQEHHLLGSPSDNGDAHLQVDMFDQ